MRLLLQLQADLCTSLTECRSARGLVTKLRVVFCFRVLITQKCKRNWIIEINVQFSSLCQKHLFHCWFNERLLLMTNVIIYISVYDLCVWKYISPVPSCPYLRYRRGNWMSLVDEKWILILINLKRRDVTYTVLYLCHSITWIGVSSVAGVWQIVDSWNNILFQASSYSSCCSQHGLCGA
jgi:hypothetical protein